MKLAPWLLAAFAPVAFAGFSSTVAGFFAVLGVTLGIFFGTLSLGRPPKTGAAQVPAE